MKKILVFPFVLCISFFYSTKGFCDWDGISEPREKDKNWPVQYTEAAKNIDKLPEVTDKVMPKRTNNSRKIDTGWTGGPGYTKTPTDGIIAPQNSNIPLSNKELIVDDGVRVLSASTPPGVQFDEQQARRILQDTGNEDSINSSDSVRDWIAKEGMTLREILIKWSEVEGWELAWNTKREYPLKASVIFRGRYKDVAAALIRTFSRATPQPHVKFFLGNKVLVVKTLEENDAS